MSAVLSSAFRTRPPAPFVLVLAVLALAVPEARAQVAEAVRHFDEGNRRYVQGDYRGALEAYEAAAAGGYASGALYYNRGNAHFRIDELGQAIRYYEKARRLMPGSRELLHNLEIARARTVDRFSRLPEPFWRPWWRWVVAVVGAGGLLAAGLVGYLLAAGLAGYRVWTGRAGDWHRRALVVSGALGVVFLALAFLAAAGTRLDRRAVVTATAVDLHEAPQASSAAALEIHEGLLLDVVARRDAWLEVRLPNGTTGWIESAAVAEI